VDKFLNVTVSKIPEVLLSYLALVAGFHQYLIMEPENPRT